MNNISGYAPVRGLYFKEVKVKVQETPLDRIKPYPNNPRVNDQAVQGVADSIQAFGFQQPIVVDKDGVIIVGHTRYKAAQQLGLAKVPVVVADNLTPDEVAAYRLADNKTAEAAIWDEGKLAIELGNIELDMSPWFDNQDLSTVEVHEQDVPETVECRAKRGDVWQLGRHRVMCGDSSDLSDMQRLVAGAPPLMVFTDPPYGVSIGSKNKAINEVEQGRGGRIQEDIEGDTLSPKELYLLLVKCFSNLKKVCDPSCSYYVSAPQGGELGLMMMMMMKDSGLPVRHNLIWKKNNATFSLGRLDYDYKHEPIFYTWDKRHEFYGKNETTVLEFDRPQASKLHPTMKPIKLVAHLMENSSKPGDTVMDIFGGSGTTLIAAEQLGRDCLMMEIDPHYVDVIIQRWEEMTGEKAVLL